MTDHAIAFIVAVNLLQVTCGCPEFSKPPSSPVPDAGASKAAYKSGEILDMPPPITLESVKTKLRETGIFDSQDPSLNEREKKELGKLFDSIEIMMTSRTRQPSNVQSMFASLRLVERVVKKQLKEGQVSDSLADKFHWEKLPSRVKRELPEYRLDKDTNMRIFNVSY
ncbi:uncharacterized protein [Choristoneura fumiferana]|uniref:uncharacterized protein n=1 Tax=Choristoneura fumiferana TaxID=7141 RepID=UPI003D153E75